MTLQLRPTFSESWYRVANLRVRLRPSAQISRQYYRGERWYVVRDPAGNQFHRLSDPAYRFIALLDGSRTVEAAWELAGGQLEDDAPTQPEVIQILSHLFSANLIDADVTPDATVLLRRHKQLNKRKMQGRLMNVLFPRIPLWDPERFLQRWMPLAKHVFSGFGAIVWIITVLAAIVVIAPRGNDLRAAAAHAVDLRANTINLLWLWAVFVFIKLIHELGHAFSCRRFGGEVHELGIMFLVFIPTPYVDASTAWGFPSRWQRMFVGAAGMTVELFFAALMAFIWAATYSPGGHELITQLAFNAMLVASVTTLIFNANPLLRYDGYYMLSDYLEIPNLRQKSTEYAVGLIKRHLFGVKSTQPLPPALQRFWLITYAIASSIYRVFIGVLIILLVMYSIPLLGPLMAIGGVITWIVLPVFKTFKYLAIEPELHRKRLRATAITTGFALAVLIVIGLIPFRVCIISTGVAEPADKAIIHAEEGGYVTSIAATDGQMMRKGDPILVCHDPDLDRQIAGTTADLNQWKAKVTEATFRDPADAAIFANTVTVYRDKLKDLLDKQSKLTIRAPIAGELIAPDLRNLQGRYLPKTMEVATVAQNDQLVVRTVLETKDEEIVFPKGAAHSLVPSEVRMSSDVGNVLKGEARLAGGANKQVANPILTTVAGEEVAADPKDPTKLANDEFEVDVPIVNPNSMYVPNQRASVRFMLQPQPLLSQWTRRFLQLLQTKSSSSAWL
jgi:putative peptide zinc metalloprotease protein